MKNQKPATEKILYFYKTADTNENANGSPWIVERILASKEIF